MSSIPKKYAPDRLSKKDKKKQLRELKKSRRLYKKKKYYTRKKVKSFKSKRSNHLSNVKKIYGIKKLKVNNELAKKTGCSKINLEKIVNKGRGAYYSSGSRPNQTAESWGIARLASAITGGKSAVIDFHLLEEGCKKNSKALKLAKKAKKVTRRRVPKVTK